MSSVVLIAQKVSNDSARLRLSLRTNNGHGNASNAFNSPLNHTPESSELIYSEGFCNGPTELNLIRRIYSVPRVTIVPTALGAPPFSALAEASSEALLLET